MPSVPKHVLASSTSTNPPRADPIGRSEKAPGSGRPLRSVPAARRSTGRIARRFRAAVEDARLVREYDGLDAVAQVELLQDVGDVRLDRRVADVQLRADLGVGKAARDQAQDLAFPRSELFDLLRGRRPRAAGELLDHALGDGGREQGVPGRNGADG